MLRHTEEQANCSIAPSYSSDTVLMLVAAGSLVFVWFVRVACVVWFVFVCVCCFFVFFVVCGFLWCVSLLSLCFVFFLRFATTSMKL